MVETNLVVWEAKREVSSQIEDPLAYMAIIRRHRLKSRKRDPTVYGICSDAGFFFHFYKLDVQGKVR